MARENSCIYIYVLLKSGKKNCSTEEQSDVNDMKKQTIADQ